MKEEGSISARFNKYPKTSSLLSATNITRLNDITKTDSGFNDPLQVIDHSAK